MTDAATNGAMDAMVRHPVIHASADLASNSLILVAGEQARVAVFNAVRATSDSEAQQRARWDLAACGIGWGSRE